jgi:hypothetical protein
MTSEDPSSSNNMPPDELNTLGILKRREIEARILFPFINALCQEFDRQRILHILRQTIIHIAHQQGRELASTMGGNTLHHFTAALPLWQKDNAIELQIKEQSEKKLAFNITRCRYAEMYQSLGIPELGKLLSCSRDHALIQGFNPHIALKRTQTIMEGSSYCDFVYQLQAPHET